jgi:hypothetical protein
MSRSQSTCLPEPLLCASAQKVRVISFTSCSCHLKIFFRCVDVTGLRIYGTVLFLWANNIISHFINMLLISRHAMKFTCYYINLFIRCFCKYSPYSKLSSASVLLSHRTHPNVSLAQVYFPYRIR